jgi:hypothetical protein
VKDEDKEKFYGIILIVLFPFPKRKQKSTFENHFLGPRPKRYPVQK